MTSPGFAPSGTLTCQTWDWISRPTFHLTRTLLRVLDLTPFPPILQQMAPSPSTVFFCNKAPDMLQKAWINLCMLRSCKTNRPFQHPHAEESLADPLEVCMGVANHILQLFTFTTVLFFSPGTSTSTFCPPDTPSGSWKANSVPFRSSVRNQSPGLIPSVAARVSSSVSSLQKRGGDPCYQGGWPRACCNEPSHLAM
jgi:hypothetical protein